MVPSTRPKSKVKTKTLQERILKRGRLRMQVPATKVAKRRTSQPCQRVQLLLQSMEISYIKHPQKLPKISKFLIGNKRKRRSSPTASIRIQPITQKACAIIATTPRADRTSLRNASTWINKAMQKRCAEIVTSSNIIEIRC